MNNTHASIVRLLSLEAMSLAELQEAINLSMPTLRRAVQELTDAGWVRTVGRSGTTGGRPAMLLGLNESKYVIIGVHIQLPGLCLVTVDLNGNILDEYLAPNNRQLLPNEVVREISDYVYHIRQTLPDRLILGIGVAAPGYIDPASGDIISIERVPTWRNFQLKTQLEANLNLPTVIENDIDCMAFECLQQIETSAEDNLIYIGFDEGVKASLILNGEFYTGPLGNAGTIGWDLLRPESSIPASYLPRVTSVHAVVELFNDEIAGLDDESRGQYEAIANTSLLRERFQMILHAADKGLPICEDIVNKMLNVLAVASANFIYMLQPTTLIIGGRLGTLSKPLFDRFEDQVRQKLPTLVSNRLVIRQVPLSSRYSVAVGGSQRFLQHYIEDEDSILVPSS
jgi:predicted NBD/HSP70 family sugar kinase